MTALRLGPQLDSLTHSCIIQNVEDLRAVLESTNPLENLLRVEESSASFVTDLLYRELQGFAIDAEYRKRCLKCLRGMGKRFHALPPSLFLNDITWSGDRPLTGGGFADIYKGRAGSLNVCLKVLRVHTAKTERKKQKIIADFCQEALIWTQLRHPSIIPLLGVNTVLFSSGFCLVSPWMANGDIVSFLKANPNHDKLQSICEIMAGLEYLHSISPPVVHGDIKGANILVSEDHHCLLADFGLAAISAETLSMIHTTSGAVKGSIRWMAPEIYAITDGVNNNKNTKEDKTPRDIYAFACTVLEIMTGKPPFSEFLIDAAVIYQVSVRRIRPERPAEGWCPDHIWKLVEVCWDEDPLKRPRAKALHSYLESLVLSRNPDPGELGFIGYFNAMNPPMCASAINGADTIDSDNPYEGRGQASDSEFGVPLTPTTGLESRSTTPRTPELPPPLPLKLPQSVNPNGIAKVEDIPAPRAPTASQYATEFFKLNERSIKGAVEHTGVVELLDWGIHRQDQYIKTALEGLYIYSSILVVSLEVVARLHPVIGVTVVAFKLSIVSFYDKQIRHIAIVDLLIRIQQTMVLFLRLRYLSDPEDRGDDGQTIWDRLQELLVNLTKDIEGAGRAIGAAISDGIDISSNYFQKFDGYQQALQRAFAHHPTLSEFSSAPSNPVKNDDSPKTGKHWETRIDSLISKFHAPSPDHSERPAGSPLSQTPSHPWNSSAGHPRGLQHQSALVKLGTSSRVCGGSLKTLYHSSSETSQRRSGGHLEEPTRPLLPSNSPSRRSLAGFEPSFRLTPPAAHLMDALTLDSLLSYSTAFLVDLADDTFNPTPIGPPLDVPNGTAFPSSRSHLLAPATSPPVSSIKLVLDDDDFVKPTSTIGLSQLEVRAVSSVSVRVTDVLEELYRALNHRITRSEWSQLTEKEKDHVSWEFHKRCSRSNQKQNVRDDGVKKVDFAKRTKFRCLVEAEGRKFKVMLE